MFDTVYPFRKTNKESGEMGSTIHRFVFRTPKRRCIIFEGHFFEAEQLAVVKFYDKAHSLSANRFSLMNHSHEAAQIIRTAVEIVLRLYADNPFLSFAFMGASDTSSNFETRRFRIYRAMLYRLFTEQAFQHLQNPQNSLYIMLNRVYCESNKDAQANIFKILASIYPEEGESDE